MKIFTIITVLTLSAGIYAGTPAKVLVTTRVISDPRYQRLDYTLYEKVETAATLTSLYNALQSYITSFSLIGAYSVICSPITGACTVTTNTAVDGFSACSPVMYNPTNNSFNCGILLPQSYMKLIVLSRAYADKTRLLDLDLPNGFKIKQLLDARANTVPAGRRRRQADTISCTGKASGEVTSQGYAVGLIINYAEVVGQADLDVVARCDVSGLIKTIKNNFDASIEYTTQVKNGLISLTKETYDGFKAVANELDSVRATALVTTNDVALSYGQIYNEAVSSNNLLDRVAQNLIDEAVLNAALSNQFSTRPVNPAFIPSRLLAKAYRSNTTYARTYIYGTPISYSILIVTGVPSNNSAKLVSVQTRSPGCDEGGCWTMPSHDFILTNDSILKADETQGDWQEDPLHVTPLFIQTKLKLDLIDGAYDLDRNTLSNNLTHDFVRSIGGSCYATCIESDTCETSLGTLRKGGTNSACNIGKYTAVQGSVYVPSDDIGTNPSFAAIYANSTVRNTLIVADAGHELRQILNEINTTYGAVTAITKPEFQRYYSESSANPYILHNRATHEAISIVSLILAIIAVTMAAKPFYDVVKACIQNRRHPRNTVTYNAESGEIAFGTLRKRGDDIFDSKGNKVSK